MAADVSTRWTAILVPAHLSGRCPIAVCNTAIIHELYFFPCRSRTGPRCQTFNNNWGTTTPSKGKTDSPRRKITTTTTRSVTKIVATSPLVTTSQSTMAMTTGLAHDSMTMQTLPVNTTGDAGLTTSADTTTTTYDGIPTADEVDVPTTTASNETTTFVQDLLTFPTTIDDNLTTTTTMASATADSVAFTTVKSIVTATTFPSDLIPTTTVIPIPEPKPENKSGNGREREINTVPPVIPGHKHDIPSRRTTTTTTTAASIPSSSTRLEGILTTTSTSIMATTTAAFYSTVSAMTRAATDRPPNEDNLVTVTLGPETTTTSTTVDIDSYDLPITDTPGDFTTVSNDSQPATTRQDRRPAAITKPAQSTEPPMTTMTTTVKWAVPWEPTMSPTTCTSDVCMNGGTCVITPDGWQVNLIFNLRVLTI